MIDLKTIVLSLVLFHNDREVIKRLRIEDGVHIPINGVALEPGDLTFDELIVSEFEEGIGVDDTSVQMKKIRQIKDILDNSVQRLYGKDSEVKTWADKLGGLKKVQEALCGHDLDVLNKWVKKFIDDLGYSPTPLGEPLIEVPVESAGPYTSYAVLAHREVKNKEAYGELRDEEESSTPNWALTEFDFNVSARPWWWKFVSMGRFRKGVPLNKVSKKLIQKNTGSGVIWVPDIRISQDIGSVPFKKVTDYEPWWKASENPKIKDFIWRFYNNPSSLKWVKIGTGNYQRWAGGMITKHGAWLWAPVTHKSSQKIDWWKDNDGKPYTVKGTRALYIGEWVIPYMNVGDQKIRVWKLKQNHNTHMFEYWTDKILTPQEWGSAKRKILSMGGKDAYFGRPWKEYVAPPKPVDLHEGDYQQF